ncbi:hypothetical protein [Undibacterium rugosum]|uniref:hypothetical protein n=1 Tax=Undibacterium rugosum TaxID=2762291 RepID=UPI001B814E60|nr:hypothetical protein [Undibacterium rugosum]MBR7780428.1 hypothetical protein [Undibacterium rugosum]
MLKPATLLMTLTFAGLTGCVGESPIEVELKSSPYFSPMGVLSVTGIYVTAKVDEVKVRSIEVNRGNCKVTGEGKSLKFGQHAYFHSPGCEIKEIEVETDEGSFTFSF